MTKAISDPKHAALAPVERRRGPAPLKVVAALAAVLLLGSWWVASSASAAPLALQLPWPTGQQHRITTFQNGYGCGGHSTYALDFNLVMGDDVSAVANGSATVGNDGNGGRGKYVQVAHADGSVSTYSHLSSYSGDFPRMVSQGRKIGEAGNTGLSVSGPGGDGSHLHFTLRKDGSDVKPEPMSGYTGFEAYGSCRGVSSPTYTSKAPGGGGGSEPPKGHFDEASSPPGGVRVRGWAFDPDDKRKSLKVHVYVGGPAGAKGAINTGVMADKSRPDVNKAYPGAGNNHGFDSTFETPKRGRQEVCAYAINIPEGSNPKLGCKVVSISDPDPKGRLEAASSPAGGQVRVRGWTFDPNDKRKSLKVHVYVGGPAGTKGAINTGVMADKSRPDVNKAYPGVGDNHGYDATFETSKRGEQRVCAYGINVGFGRNKLLGCGDVVIGAPLPPAAPLPPPASPPGADSDPAPPADALVPALRGLRLTRSRLHRGGRRGRRSTYLRFTLSTPARVSLSVMRRQRGIRLRVRVRSEAGRSRLVRRCVAPTGRTRRRLARRVRRISGERGRRRAIRRSRCGRWVRKARLVRAGEQGANRIRFSARIGKRRLPTGTYRIHGRATSVAGSKSDLARSNRFRVVR